MNWKYWLRRIFQLLFTYERWNIGYIEQTPEELISSKKLNENIYWLKEGRPEYAADPFPINIGNDLLIFFEEMSFWNGKGKLMSINVSNPKIKKRITGLGKKNIHLSYPYLFEDGGKWFCIPETSMLGEVAIYQIDEKQPEKLNKLQTILSGALYVDSSLIYYKDRYWLFTSHSGNPDQLYIYHSTELTGQFHPHDLNPIKMERNEGRSAGRPFTLKGKLYLPCQNPAKCYGGSVFIKEITELTQTTFSCTHLFELMPRSPYNRGLHTINFHQGLIIIDGKRLVLSPIASLKKLSKKLRENFS
ncbi:MAG: hypothetical protein EOP00_00325 [Pedobacter sp.]|nr:MAG: hypothetical protein EOP00_00325 [Pedobacter sp.]